MLNKYYYENKMIVDIIKKGSKNTRYLVFDDGTEMKYPMSSKIKIQTVCNKCGQLSNPTYFYYSKDKNEYICPKCRGIYYNPFYGKHHSEKTKSIISKKAIERDYNGNRNPMYGKSIKDYMTEEKYEEWKQNIRETMLKNPPMKGEKLKDHMTEEKYEEWKQNIKNVQSSFSDEKKKEISKKLSIKQQEFKNKNEKYYKEIKRKAGHISHLQQMSYKMNKLEKKVENWLKSHSIDYDYCCIMGFGDSCYQYDFIIHKKRILIEVQGDYWHANKKMFNKNGTNGKRKISEMQEKKIKKDKDKAKFAKSKGFDMIYIWESDINNNNYSALEGLI